jgi:hypothetical protein
MPSLCPPFPSLVQEYVLQLYRCRELDTRFANVIHVPKAAPARPLTLSVHAFQRVFTLFNALLSAAWPRSAGLDAVLGPLDSFLRPSALFSAVRRSSKKLDAFSAAGRSFKTLFWGRSTFF